MFIYSNKPVISRRAWLSDRLREFAGLGTAGAILLGMNRSAEAGSATCPYGYAGRNSGGLYQYTCCICINGVCTSPAGGLVSQVQLQTGCNSPSCIPRSSVPPKALPAPCKILPAQGAVVAGHGWVSFEQYWGKSLS